MNVRTLIQRIVVVGLSLINLACTAPSSDELLSILVGSWAGEDGYSKWCQTYFEDGRVLKYSRVTVEGTVHETKLEGYWAVARGGRFRVHVAPTDGADGSKIAANSGSGVKANYLLTDFSADHLNYKADDTKKDRVFMLKRVVECMPYVADQSSL